MQLSLDANPLPRRAPGPLVLLVMDGVGLAPDGPGNAVSLAHTPTLDMLSTGGAQFRSLRAHGTAVGMPSDSDMGNSEVGHNAMGAGRIYEQGALLVKNAVESGALFEGAPWRTIVDRCTAKGGSLHLIGLLSDGNVHSHETHLHEILRQAARGGIPSVCVHPLLDGRDVAPTSALVYVDRLEAVLAEITGSGGRNYRIASGGGRMTTTMDRYEADWEMVHRGWEAQVHGIGRRFPSIRKAIETFRLEQPGIGDQSLPTFVIAADGEPAGRMRDGDCVVFFNFRGDRALEVSRAFEGGPEFDAFERGEVPELYYAGMTLYDSDAGIPGAYLVQPPAIERTISEYLSSAGVRQLAIAETQKFGHVTYFWNGNRSGCFDPALEEYEEIGSLPPPFTDRPWMRSAETTDRCVEVLAAGAFDFVRLNFAAGDMVGHTGDLDATIVAISSIDLCLRRVVEAVDRAQGTLIVTADHGNAEAMLELGGDGQPVLEADGTPRRRNSHSLNPVGFWLRRTAGPALTLREDLPDAGLANLAATILEVLGFVPPADYLPSLLAP